MPRTLLLLAVAAMTLGSYRCGGLPGDANLDGVVDGADAAFVLACLGIDPLAGLPCLSADLDGDGAVTHADRDFAASYFADLACNGDMTLCDRRFDQVAYPTTHNGFSALQDGFDPLAANHTSGMRQQLIDGVRGFMLDTHYDLGNTWLCHSSCFLGSTLLGRIDLVEGLGWIDTHLRENPGSVVTIILESYISEADTEAAFVASGLIDHVHSQTPGQPWPTLREMIRNGRRLVVLTGDSSASLPWHHYMWTHAFETDYNFSVFDYTLEFLVDLMFSVEGCAVNRGTSASPLFILNHFITATAGHPTLAAAVNFEPDLGDRALLCGGLYSRVPNFITVDYYEVGDLLAATARVNAAF
ncbi:MAG: hypothetical protein JRH10_21635 [Deltaproteobacteria bacterium]|nr:hypothetical protein [Deltaproteobacteria bacterium]MBW2448081.1 hypothetical protein [Deltaproteobacteria bacterium]